MRMIWNKGHRIRASDKHLVYHFSIGTLLFVFVPVLLLLNIKQLMRADWEHFSLFENGLTLPLQLHNHTDSDWCLCMQTKRNLISNILTKRSLFSGRFLMP